MEKLLEENDELKKRICDLEDELKKYKSTHRQKKYYEKHTETIKLKNKEYTEKMRETNPEKIKEWNRTAYLKRKDKLKVDRDKK